MAAYKGQYVFNFFKASQKEMQEKLQGLIKKIIKLLIDTNYREMERLFEECKPVRYSAQGYLEKSKIPNDEKKTLVNAGYVYGMLDVMQMYLRELNAHNEIQQVNTKYRDEILSVLSKTGTMLHGDLASAIGVSASGLNAVIKKMNATSVKLIHVEEVSKYKLYSVTPVAYNYIIAKNPEVQVECELFNESRRKEQLLKYMIEINKLVNERKIPENSVKNFDERNRSKIESDKKYTRGVENIVYSDKFVKRMAL